MAEYPATLQRVIGLLQALPGVGARTAERMALSLLDWPSEDLHQLGETVAELKETVSYCAECGHFAENDLCGICADASRDSSKICVVEGPAQIPVIERSGVYAGLYHVLGGRLVPVENRGPESLRLQELTDRINRRQVREVIMAISPDVEGEATIAYVADELGKYDVKVTRLAAGIPVGAELSYADAATISMAIHSRQPTSTT